ncbi:hypothetical protein FHS70_002072 [Flammeovirga yaeyamensis]|nr:hypothetical protein [Flammeovirga yaeyamensis]
MINTSNVEEREERSGEEFYVSWGWILVGLKWNR